MSHQELCGDSLIVIYNGCFDYFTQEKVRWCPKCGAVVVDEDTDGRISPGSIRKMQFPLNYVVDKRP
jgi:hypothetical protein